MNILEKLVDFVVNNQFSIFNCIFNKANYKKILNKKFGSSIKIDPYLLGFTCISNAYNEYLIEQQKNGMIFLDEIRDKIKDVDILYDKLLSFNFECDTSNIIEKVVYLDSCKNNFIQMVDICNFYINKHYCIEIFNTVANPIKKQHCIDMYNKIKPYIIDCNLQFDEELIEKFLI